MKFNRLLIFTILFVLIASCTNKEALLPSDAKITPNHYSRLFVLAANSSDSFLILKDPKDSGKFIGRFFWGKSSSYDGFTKIKGRRQLAALSAVFIGMIEALNKQNIVTAVDETRYITSPKTRKLITAGKVSSVAINGKLDNEKLLAQKPDIIFTYYVDPGTKASYQRIEQTGIPVLFCQNYLENHPLARAEWIKVFGWLLGDPDKSEAIFNEIETHYTDLKSKVETMENKPVVLINAPFSGVWDAPCNESFMSVIIRDAGAEYVWNNIPGTGRKAISVEEAFKKAQFADIWINPGAIETSAEIQKADSRFMKIKAVKNKRVYNSTKLKNETYGNAYWEYGVLRPDLVLKDLVTIFHPEFPLEHQTVFFQQLKF